MIEQAEDFRAESAALHALLEGLSDAEFGRITQFKNWTLNDILTHLHLWNKAADLALADEAGLLAFIGRMGEWFKAKAGTMREFETREIGGLKGQALLAAWRDYYQEMASHYLAAEPKQRVKWVGPEMSARSGITARLMETWAHGQAAYDILGVERQHEDRIKNIAVLGMNTYGWTFQVRELSPPDPKPYVCLTAPSGARWQWGEPNEENKIEGAAVAFCQVVTQTRNIADVDLRVKGAPAQMWMENAQCFAGGVQPPPAPRTRFIVEQ